MRFRNNLAILCNFGGNLAILDDFGVTGMSRSGDTEFLWGVGTIFLYIPKGPVKIYGRTGPGNLKSTSENQP